VSKKHKKAAKKAFLEGKPKKAKKHLKKAHKCKKGKGKGRGKGKGKGKKSYF